MQTGITAAKAEDAGMIAALAVQIWKSHTVDELEAEFKEMIANQDSECFVCYKDDKVVAFAQCGLRHDYVEGTESSPVGYLEGIFVLDEYRHQGIARDLLSACEHWTKEKGCLEFASDCELDNEESLKFHTAVGFREANRIICFHKKLY
ncbi:MAG: aminoglycoside 6'-N-acetyltransferase [Roseburia sp.]